MNQHLISHSAAHRISLLSKVVNAKTYLEIGVRDGATFLNVDIPYKIAVDPNFIFDTKKATTKGSYFFSTTSDAFFANLHRRDVQPEYQACWQKEEQPLFDIIFIDGLHSFEQSFKDFRNSLPFAHKDTIWLLDDTVPCDPYSAFPDYEKSLQIRQQAGLTGNSWHGDVFKTIFAIHDKYPNYSYCTLMRGNPQTIIKFGSPVARTAIFTSLGSIAHLTYFDMLNYAQLFNIDLQDEETAIRNFIANGSPEPIYEKELWKRLIYRQVKSF